MAARILVSDSLAEEGLEVLRQDAEVEIKIIPKALQP